MNVGYDTLSVKNRSLYSSLFVIRSSPVWYQVCCTSLPFHQCRCCCFCIQLEIFIMYRGVREKQRPRTLNLIKPNNSKNTHQKKKKLDTFFP